ncbi:MAG TPA: cysteine desulfurase NifS [Myxococcales bacterium]|nr:cysteine desulfurase NifS [Myxococcales bacterium]
MRYKPSVFPQRGDELMSGLINKTYLDHHATTPLCEASRRAMQHLLASGLGNPSSIHGSGQAARHWLERARAQVAAAVDCPPRCVVFTSGATEANALAWQSVSRVGTGTAVTTHVEHAGVTMLADEAESKGWQVVRLSLSPKGNLHLHELPPSWEFASALMVSNELGLRLPVEELCRQTRNQGGLFHTDATQALGKINLKALDADFISLSAHKIGGPSGVGALVVNDGVELAPLWPGHQERGLRAGTENLLGVVGFGAACEDLPTRIAAMDRVRKLRDSLATGIANLGTECLRHLDNVDPKLETGSCLSVAFLGIDAADLVMGLDIEGIAISAGSACSSGTLQPSPVIAHLVRDQDRRQAIAKGTIRISLGPENTEQDVEHALRGLKTTLTRLTNLR